MTGPTESAESDQNGAEREQEDPGWPWSFLLLVAAGALYLAFRLVDFVMDVLR